MFSLFITDKLCHCLLSLYMLLKDLSVNYNRMGSCVKLLLAHTNN